MIVIHFERFASADQRWVQWDASFLPSIFSITGADHDDPGLWSLNYASLTHIYQASPGISFKRLRWKPYLRHLQAQLDWKESDCRRSVST